METATGTAPLDSELHDGNVSTKKGIPYTENNSCRFPGRERRKVIGEVAGRRQRSRENRPLESSKNKEAIPEEIHEESLKKFLKKSLKIPFSEIC
jgi:hypothetical protein